MEVSAPLNYRPAQKRQVPCDHVHKDLPNLPGSTNTSAYENSSPRTENPKAGEMFF